MSIDKKLLITGIPLIDKQHQAYAELVDRFFELATNGHVARQTLVAEISAVIKYAVEHFDAEEFIMRIINYPAYDEHRAKHNLFRARADTLPSELAVAEDLDLYIVTLCKWLIEWLVNQVQDDDMKLADFLRRLTHEQFSNLPALRHAMSIQSGNLLTASSV
jgi:hemerythrin